MHLKRKCKWNAVIASIANNAVIANNADNDSRLDRFAFAAPVTPVKLLGVTPLETAMTAMLAMSRGRR
jgi:hypothetical protein